MKKRFANLSQGEVLDMPPNVLPRIDSLYCYLSVDAESVHAPDAEAAIAKAIEEFKIPQNLHRKLAARRVNY